MTRFAVVDVETTGSSPVEDRITEVAIFIHDGEKTLDSYTTLVNPEREIPYYITRLTGINNRMVAEAPKFYEVAERVVKMTEGAIFTAHNANFDYSFVKSEFKRLGYQYRRRRLCTVQLSRMHLPGRPSYSLGKLCASLGITIEGRHRAWGDAAATVRLLEYIAAQAYPEHFWGSVETLSKNGGLPQELEAQTLDELPEAAGVYYFLDDDGRVIYVGKSLNIRERVRSHFYNDLRSPKAFGMKLKIADVHYQTTGNELVALLLESEEIKRHKPLYNVKGKRSGNGYGIFHYTDGRGYLRFTIERTRPESNPVAFFPDMNSAKNFLDDKVWQLELCPKLCNMEPFGLRKSAGPCFQHQLRKCRGACVEKESPQDYNARANVLVSEMGLGEKNVVIVGPGRDAGEKAFVVVEQGRYVGFCFAPECTPPALETLKSKLNCGEHNRDVRQIIKSFLTRPAEHYEIHYF
jgi:DNA polymerase-3 subunit epsilon